MVGGTSDAIFAWAMVLWNDLNDRIPLALALAVMLTIAVTAGLYHMLSGFIRGGS